MNQELLNQCIASGQVSAAQVHAHHAAGELHTANSDGSDPHSAQDRRTGWILCGLTAAWSVVFVWALINYLVHGKGF